MKIKSFDHVPTRFKAQLTDDHLELGTDITLICGNPATGKTHAAIDAVYRLLKSDDIDNALYLTPQGVTDAILKAIQGRRSKAEVTSRITESDAIIVDELFSSDKSLQDSVHATLREIIFTRSNERRRTVLITNRSKAWLQKNLDAGYTSRLFDNSRGSTVYFLQPGRLKGMSKPGDNWSLRQPDWYHDCIRLSNETHHHNGELKQSHLFGNGEKYVLAQLFVPLPNEAIETLRQWHGDSYLEYLRSMVDDANDAINNRKSKKSVPQIVSELAESKSA